MIEEVQQSQSKITVTQATPTRRRAGVSGFMRSGAAKELTNRAIWGAYNAPNYRGFTGVEC